MSYKEPLVVIEIKQKLCNYIYGEGYCEAELGVTGEDRCYNTLATCQDEDNYDEGELILYFGTDNAKFDGKYIMPFVKNISISPVVINPAGSSSDLSPLGKRASASIQMVDPPHTDFVVDPYVEDRTFNPELRSTFWRKWIARNPYYRYYEIKVLQGYVGDAYDDLESRTYLIDKIDIKDGSVNITAKDPLVLVAQKQSQAPKATGGRLTADLNDSANTFTAEGCLDGEYPSSGIIRVNEEVMTYTGTSVTDDEVTFTGVVRGEYGTEASEHEAEDRVQLCLKYTNQLVHDIIYDLMTVYAEVPEEYIDYYEWEEESEGNLALYVLTGLITEPTGVDALIGEILESTIAYVYWDERETLMKLKAYRPPVITPNTITEIKDVLAGSFSISDNPDSRLNQVWLFWGQKDPTDQLTNDKNYSRLRVRTLGEDNYKDRNVRKIYSRWLKDDAQALDLTAKLLARFQEPAKKISLSLLDNDTFWTGDYVRVETKRIVDKYGEPITASCEIISARKNLSTIDYELQSYSYITPPSVPIPENMIILALNGLYGYQLYDGTNGTIDLIGKYLKCSDKQGGTGGSETHQHSPYSGNSGKNPLVHFRNYPDNFYGGRDHTHSINHLHAAVENNHPHIQVIPYVPDEYSVLRASMLMFYCGESVPDGWEIKIDLINKYIKCGLSYSAAGGSAAHQHSHIGNSGATTPDHYAFGAVKNDECSDDNSHTHSIAHVHELLNNLIYIGVIPVTISTAEEIPSGMCAFFIGDVPPAGWSVYSAAKGRFIKLSETSGGTGGSTTHSHNDSFTTGPGGGKEDDGYNEGYPRVNVGLPSHTHPMGHAHDEQDWQPPYQELMFCRKDYES